MCTTALEALRLHVDEAGLADEIDRVRTLGQCAVTPLAEAVGVRRTGDAGAGRMWDGSARAAARSAPIFRQLDARVGVVYASPARAARLSNPADAQRGAAGTRRPLRAVLHQHVHPGGRVAGLAALAWGVLSVVYRRKTGLNNSGMWNPIFIEDNYAESDAHTSLT